MPNPQVPADIRKRRGTFRPDRDYAAEAEAEDEALTEYKALARAAYARAMKGDDVAREIEYLRQAEAALARNGITTREGARWNFSTLVKIATASQH